MTYFILAYLAGALTIFAPCILPVVPFVFARVDQPFVKGILPMFAGMALTFTGVASLGAAAGAWAVQTNEYGRMLAIAALAVSGAMLIAPSLAERVTRPLVTLGSGLSNIATQRAGHARHPAVPSFLLGTATGLLWAPCAGPVLGLIFTAAALEGPSVRTSLLLLAYAAGAVSSLAIVLSAGKWLLATIKRHLGVGEWVRKGLGVAVLAGVAAIALNLDTGVLSDLSQGSGSAWETRLLQRFSPPAAPMNAVSSVESSLSSDSHVGRFLQVQAREAPPRLDLPSEGAMPPLAGAVEWLNSPPLGAEELRGKVVLIDFWTFGCINCRNALPYVREWNRKYKNQGLVVIGVHSPEFAFEKNIGNLKRALGDLDLSFPIAVDNNFAVWRAFNNNYWPAHYFIDAKGQIRFHHFGEGEYEKSEQVIKQLLDEARKEAKPV